MNNVKSLLENDFLTHYNITSNVEVDSVITENSDFDLDDMVSPIELFPIHEGKVSFHNNKGELCVVPYENFINQCKRPRSFENGLKRCDFLLIHTKKSGIALLVEITSGRKSEDLKLPIKHPTTGDILYGNGKLEKCEDQLFCSLKTLKEVPSIAKELDSHFRRICLMAYQIKGETDKLKGVASRPYERYLRIEARTTSEDGAIVPCPKIESMGFEYRRIEHSHVFVL